MALGPGLGFGLRVDIRLVFILCISPLNGAKLRGVDRCGLVRIKNN